MKSKVAIVILNYNDYVNTLKYVNIIKKYDVIDKVIIVDNNSTDESTQELKKIECDKIDVILSDKNNGYACGNNIGLRYLDSKYSNDNFKYVIISNPDISIEENAIYACIDEFENNFKTAIVAPRMYYLSGASRRSAWKSRTFFIDIANSTRISEIILFPLLKKGEYSKTDFNKERLNVDVIAGSFFMADLNKFREIGYFDENTFLFYEEDIIGFKIKEKNYTITSLNNYKFIHYDSQTISKVIKFRKKIDILFDSKKYYHKFYNKVGKYGIIFINVLKYVRRFELIFEVPIRNLYLKLKI